MGVKKSCTFYAVSQIISVPTRPEVCGDVCVDDKYISNYSWKNLRRRVGLEDQGVDGRIILKLMLGK